MQTVGPLSAKLAPIRKYAATNRKKVRARQDKWHEAHPKKVCAYSVKRRAEHPEEVRAARKKWWQAHPERGKAHRRKWRVANKRSGLLAVNGMQQIAKGFVPTTVYSMQPIANLCAGKRHYRSPTGGKLVPGFNIGDIDFFA